MLRIIKIILFGKLITVDTIFEAELYPDLTLVVVTFVASFMVSTIASIPVAVIVTELKTAELAVCTVRTFEK
jgi:hypothetical protein